MVTTDYRLVRRARPPQRRRTTEVDPFGFDPEFHARARPAVEWLYRKYWRVTVEGIENVPARGAALIVGNHSGGIPFDAVMLAAALHFDHPHPRVLRFLYDRFVDGMPLMGTIYRRLGAAVASYENGLALARRGDAVGIFPEGVDGIAKGLARRYQLQRFRTGFVRISFETGCPIVPVTVVGAEEIYPVIGRWKPAGALADLLNVPFIPVTPFFPWLGPFGAFPLPTRWHIRFGEPLRPFEKPPRRPPTRQDFARLAETVRRRMQNTLHEMLARRDRLF